MPTPAAVKLPAGQQRGVVVKFDAERGFGFIRPDCARGATNQDVYVHVRNVEGRHNLQPGQAVTFQVTKTDKGLAAIKVEPGSVFTVPIFKALLIVGLVVVVMLGAAAILFRGQASGALWLLAWIVATSVAAFILYGYDKSQAGQGGQRVPEMALHLISFVGGSPGSFVGMKYFRHKTSEDKQAFRTVFWLIVAVQAAGLVWWFLLR